MADEAERIFLKEAISCYHHSNFRAAIIMAWNLAYDHLLRWIVADSGRTAAFQANIAGRIGQKKAASITVANRESFEDVKEAETLDICGSAGLFPSGNIKKILDMQLTKRNLPRILHCRRLARLRPTTPLTSLVQNVVLVLK